MITESEAIDELDTQARRESRSRQATGALVRIGHGLIDECRAARLSTEYWAALAAITEMTTAVLDARGAVERPLSLYNRYLPGEGELEVERALRSEWIRGGGDPYEFPGTTPWNAELLDVASLGEGS